MSRVVSEQQLIAAESKSAFCKEIDPKPMNGQSESKNLFKTQSGLISPTGRLHYFLAVGFCLSLLVAVVLDWANFYGLVNLYAKKIVHASVFLVFIIFLFDPTLWKGRERFPLALPFLAFGMLVLVYALYKNALADEIYYTSRILFWISGGFYVYELLCKDLFPKRIFFFVIDLIVVFYFVMVLYTLLDTSVRYTQNISIYTLLWCVPVLMLQKKTKTRTAFIILACFGVLLSFKRGAMIALVFSFLCYHCARIFLIGSFREFVKAFCITFFLATIVMLSVQFVRSVRPEFYQRRISDLSSKDSYGSGRSVFYAVIVEHYLYAFNHDAVHFFFGYGSRSVQKLLAEYYGVAEEFGAYAHSDWLQIMHDYGLAGIGILAWLHMAIIRLIFKRLRKKDEMLPPLAMTYAIFFLLNLYSGFFFSPNAVYFSIFLSYNMSNNVEKRDTLRIIYA